MSGRACGIGVSRLLCHVQPMLPLAVRGRRILVRGHLALLGGVGDLSDLIVLRLDHFGLRMHDDVASRGRGLVFCWECDKDRGRGRGVARCRGRASERKVQIRRLLCTEPTGGDERALRTLGSLRLYRDGVWGKVGGEEEAEEESQSQGCDGRTRSGLPPHESGVSSGPDRGSPGAGLSSSRRGVGIWTRRYWGVAEERDAG
jgi:hypothetical protein